MKSLFFLISIFLSIQSISQTSTKELNGQEKKYFQTIIDISTYLKEQETVPLVIHESPTYSKDENFYDEVINKYFEVNKTRQLLTQDTSVFAFQGKMDMMRHILNEADYFLDIIPSDSIFVRPFKSKELQNVLEVYLMVNRKEIPILLCHFDPVSNLLIGLSGGASPRTEEFMAYLKRQKNYYEFPDPTIKN
jgi:hypothetical protein